MFVADDSKWRIDTPENPDSVLAILRYQEWGGTPEAPVTTQGNPINLLYTTVSFDLMGDGLDLHGGHATFWVVKAGQRWHYVAAFPEIIEGEWTHFEVDIAASSVADWYNSWAVDPPNVVTTLTGAVSYGIAFVDFAGVEPTGAVRMRNFLIEPS